MNAYRKEFIKHFPAVLSVCAVAGCVAEQKNTKNYEEFDYPFELVSRGICEGGTNTFGRFELQNLII